MRQGYLLLETPPELPGSVSLRALESQPAAYSPNQRFVARFKDIDAALMHFHAALSRHLVDLNRRLYRVDIREAVAVADAIELDHRRTYLDPSLSDDTDITERIERLHWRHRVVDRFLHVVGILAIILLVLLGLPGV